MFNLIRLVIICIIIYFAYRLVKWIIFSPGVNAPDLPGRQASVTTSEELIEDPYCHTYVPMSQAYKSSIEGQEVFFCSQKCYEKYIVENPMKKAREAS